MNPQESLDCSRGTKTWEKLSAIRDAKFVPGTSRGPVLCTSSSFLEFVSIYAFFRKPSGLDSPSEDAFLYLRDCWLQARLRVNDEARLLSASPVYRDPLTRSSRIRIMRYRVSSLRDRTRGRLRVFFMSGIDQRLIKQNSSFLQMRDSRVILSFLWLVTWNTSCKLSMLTE